LSIKENYSTQESLRTIWMLLESNKQIIVDMSEPNYINWSALKVDPENEVKEEDLEETR
jgi:hypothetical protein